MNPRRTIHYLLWAFVFALIFDGALRKWVLPGMSDVLLLSRVPITGLIYLLAIQVGMFPRNIFVLGAVILAGVTSLTAYLTHGSIPALGYGALANYFFIPLIFIFPKVWDWKEVQRVGKFFLLIGIPMTVLVGLQFYLPQSAWVNLSVGGTEGAGFTGGLGRYRPPATFSFITGTAQFYTLVSAFFLVQFIHRKTLSSIALIAIGICLPLAIFGSISRLLAVSVAVVFVMTLLMLVYNGRKLPSSFRIIGVILFTLFVASQFNFFDDAKAAFEARWESSTGEHKGGVREAIVMRTIRDLTQPFIYMWEIPLPGYGLGSGTQAGAQILRGQRGFAYAEGEWGRLLAELGPIFGTFYVLLRLSLVIFLGRLAFKQAQKNNFLPWTIFSASLFLILIGQWGQQTSLGFAILGAGLTLSACRTSTRRIPKKAIKLDSNEMATVEGESNA